jgi:hypothetical protein
MPRSRSRVTVLSNVNQRSAQAVDTPNNDGVALLGVLKKLFFIPGRLMPVLLREVTPAKNVASSLSAKPKAPNSRLSIVYCLLCIVYNSSKMECVNNLTDIRSVS